MKSSKYHFSSTISQNNLVTNIHIHRHTFYGASDALGWGTAPQWGRLRVRIPVGSLKIYKLTYFILFAFRPFLTEMTNKGFPLGGQMRPELTADNSVVLAVPNV